MKLSTTLNHISRLEGRIKDTYSMASIYRLDSDTFFAELARRVWEDPAFARLPEWAKHRLWGYDRARWDCFFRYELETRVLLDGQYIYGKDVPKGRWVDVVPGGNGKTWFYKDTLDAF